MYHIRRDGGWICLQDKNKWRKKRERHISFSIAHLSGDLEGICNACKKRYYEILKNLKDPIIVKDRKNTPKKKKSNQIITEPGIKPYGN